jgi:acyl-CoA synthetase (AMP-forming)/AMP-acid ligase II
VQFTSGSTSNPKGVVLSGTALARNVLSVRDAIDLGDGDLTVSWLPLSHDMGFVGMLLTPLVATAPRFQGRGAVIMRPEHFVRDPTRWLRTCSHLAATATTVPNFAFDLATKSRSRHDRLDLSPLRVCITGAEPVRAQSVRNFVSAFADAGIRDETISPAYGMAENGLAVTCVRPHERWHAVTVGSTESAGSIEVVSTGSPLDGISVRTRPADEQIGEIEFASPSLLDRYLGAEVPWTDDGWFHTRDSGFVQGGQLFILGRHDDAIVLDGRNIYPEDIEGAVDTLDLRPNSVAAIPWGDRGVAIVAEAKRSGHDLTLTANAMLEAVTRRTGVVVSALYFVKRGSLARTSSGKLQRKKVAALLRSGELDLLGKFGRDA